MQFRVFIPLRNMLTLFTTPMRKRT